MNVSVLLVVVPFRAAFIVIEDANGTVRAFFFVVGFSFKIALIAGWPEGCDVLTIFKGFSSRAGR